MSVTTRSAGASACTSDRAPRIADRGFGDNCGKLCAVLHPYQREYQHARHNILLGTLDGRPAVFIDNLLLKPDRAEGLFLRLECLIDGGDTAAPLKTLSTSKAFAAAPGLIARIPPEAWTAERTPIADRLAPEMFFFRRTPVSGPEGDDVLEAALAPVMPALVTSARPALDAARYHTQVEFDRTYRSIQGAPEYRGKNLLFVAGLNVDVSPREGMPFPLTKFVPWAAYAQFRSGATLLLEQDALVETLLRQCTVNADQLSFDAAIQTMAEAEGISLPN
jgi:hypothetical protein